MSDIEQLRQNVIDAARAYVRGPGNGAYQRATDWDRMLHTLDALDAAERPDPWKLLGEVWEYFAVGVDPDVDERVEAALKWREQNPDA